MKTADKGETAYKFVLYLVSEHYLPLLILNGPRGCEVLRKKPSVRCRVERLFAKQTQVLSST